MKSGGKVILTSCASLAQKDDQNAGRADEKAQEHQDDSAGGHYATPKHPYHRPDPVRFHRTGSQGLDLVEDICDVVSFPGRGRDEGGKFRFGRRGNFSCPGSQLFRDGDRGITIRARVAGLTGERLHWTSAGRAGEGIRAHSVMRINENLRWGKYQLSQGIIVP